MNFSEVKFYENYLTSDFHTNAVISRCVCALVKMASKTVKSSTVEPRVNEVPRNWANWVVISRARYIENLVIPNLLENNQSVRYIGV